MIFGYARVSSNEQNLDRQLKELEAYGCEDIIVEKQSGVMARPEFENLLKYIRKNDVVVCHDLTRFGRSQIHILQVIQELREKQAGLVTLKERIDTREDNPYSDLIVSIFSATAEFERKMIKERQREGIEIAKNKGAYKGGRKRYHSGATGKEKVIYDEVIRLLHQQESVMNIHRRTGLSRNTIYNIKHNKNINRP
ncbi:transposase [Thalassobacillus devorans]|uniref:Transposase n=1 Tax=Thalassobacillus devorans TaxID=279813 RepID=A0ABQ1P328_9BACI|nr:recombinase family protein [Thalassobacillus devorans]NIK28202.1 DNA invertase Pin-like site-specific DNA recombinase [Thalassobacillus devorans]GGC88093.1 transposase [Thalassobacillus devorans]